MPYGYYYHPEFHIIGGIITLLFWVLIIWLIISLIRRSRGGNWNGPFMMGPHDMHSHGGRAMDILKERYAKGEINKQEFEEKKKDLE